MPPKWSNGVLAATICGIVAWRTEVTAGELIARLSQFDPDQRVVMPSEDMDFCEVQNAFGDLVWFDGNNAQLSDERSPLDNVAVVRLFGPDGG